MTDTRNAITGFIHDGKRLREIATVLATHGLHEFARLIGLESFVATSNENEELDQHNLAIRARRVCEDLGPTFIKLAQILSTRPDILPPVFIQEFKKLQDSAPTIPFEEVERQLQTAFGVPITELFDNFEKESIATASIAQVHKALLKDGTQVAVKVQRPGIGPVIKSDLAILYYLARFGEATVDEVGLYNPVAIVKTFERAIVEELNFLTEAANTKRARTLASPDTRVIVAEVFEELTTPTVITQTFIDGQSIGDVEPGTENAKVLVEIAMEAAFNQIFRDGFFHGDPHPGNMLVRDGEVAFLDWGLVGKLSRAQQNELIDLILAISMDDADGITRIVLRMGLPEGRVNLRALRSDVQRVRDQYLTLALEDIEITQLMEDIMELAHKYRIRVNPEYALLSKATATVEGILRTVYPDLDIVSTLKPYAERLIRDRFDGKQVVQRALGGLINLNHLVQDVPMQLDQVLMDIEGGELKINVEHPALDAHTNAMTVLGSRILMGFISSALIVGGSMMMTTQNWTAYDVPLVPILGGVFFFLALLFGFSALSWHFVIGGWRKLRLAPWLSLLRRK